MTKATTKAKNNLRVVGMPEADVIADFKIALMSRHASLIGRKEVLTGKAKFGIFGDGKEVAQLAMAKAFQRGDWRSGYYRDQTFMFAIGASNVKEFFSQLYADTDPSHEPASAGRQMNSHFATRYLTEEGAWLRQTELFNSAADLSPTAAQMAKLVGLAYASKLYRQQAALHDLTQFSRGGNEVAFGTIGNASTSEGIFWESINAAGVLRVPLAMSIWDDEYGISVHNAYQTTKGSISEALSGFRLGHDRYSELETGFDIHVVKGWDYEALCKTYMKGVEKIRTQHIPAIFHVIELGQPQGHSTSGSHERYKSKDRLSYENSIDCIERMREWMIDSKIATADQLAEWDEKCRAEVERFRQQAWDEYLHPIQSERKEALELLEHAGRESQQADKIATLANELRRAPTLNRKLIHQSVRRALHLLHREHGDCKSELQRFADLYMRENRSRYGKHLYNEQTTSALQVEEIAPSYSESPEVVHGRLIIQKCMNHHLTHNPRVFIVGEDVGKLGGVNLEFDGLNAEHGELRVTDTGIREATIVGQAIGAAMRGLRPIADIQYLDYLLYAFQLMSDDLSTLHYRSAGNQIAPVIVRTKGHRLEGIWHSGSPMGVILSGLRGMHVCVPRNMTQAAGMYNTLFQSDDPALVIEVLNAYRSNEKVPDNVGEFTVPLGKPEVLREGKDLTLVTYGACVRVAEEACELLQENVGIEVELIDVQTLIPFDRFGVIRRSLEKTSALLVLDEDVSGAASAYVLQKIIDEQGAYELLDATPKCLSAQDHRPPYGTDGDYYCKPSVEDVYDAVFAQMYERDPARFSS